MSLARERGMTAGGSVLFLTVLGTLSQLLGFGYRVALSRMVGAEVMASISSSCRCTPSSSPSPPWG